MINLRKLEIEGFGSVIDRVTYRLDRIGLNKIEGPNGAGKTTITNALAWVGWGQLVKPKKSTFQPWPHVIKGTQYKGTYVSLYFDDGNDKFQIIRGADYSGKINNKALKNRLLVLKNGVELIGNNLRDKRDYQKWIIDKIGYSFDLLKSTVLFTQELDSIIREDGPGKKKVFDEAFETTFINIARKKVETRLKGKEVEQLKVNGVLEVQMEKVRGALSAYNIIKEGIVNHKRIIKEQIQEKEIKVKELTTKIGSLKVSKKVMKAHKKLELALKKYPKHEKKAIDLEFKTMLDLNKAQGSKEDIEMDIAKLKTAFQSSKPICERCKRPYPKEDIIKTKQRIKKDIGILRVKQKELEKIVDTLNKQHIAAEGALENIKHEKSQILKLQAKLPNIELIKKEKELLIKQRAGYLEDIEKLKQKKPDTQKLTNIKKEITQTKSKRDNIKQELKVIKKDINVDRWLMKDPLSNSGLKAFIFDSMLGRVNGHLREYKQLIGFGVTIYIDMESANKDIRISIHRDGDEVPFEDISKGQKQLVAVCLAFAMSDTINAIKPINLMILDELFESLNKENIEKVGNLIMQKARKKSIHLITHQSTFSPTNCYTTYVSLNKQHQTKLSSS